MDHLPRINTEARRGSEPASEAGDGARGRFLLVLVGVLILHRIPLLLKRGVDVDEMQHLHGAFSISQGLTPHVDYFEHHSSWFAWLLSAPLELIGPSWSAVMAARGLMAACAAAGLLLTYALARRFGGGLIPGVAVALHATTLLFVDKSLEIRPDVPAAALWTLAVLLTVDGLRGGPRRSFAGAGTALGFGLLFTFKLAFGAIGLGLAVRRGHSARRTLLRRTLCHQPRRLLALGLQVLCLQTPCLLALGLQTLRLLALCLQTLGLLELGLQTPCLLALSVQTLCLLALGL